MGIDVFIGHPWLALLPAAFFAALFVASRRHLAAAAAALWLIYAVYEYGMHRRWLCSGECNIRVDLLLLYPILLLTSAAAATVAVRAVVRRRGA